MIRKLKFYERYGVEEYYIYDPDDIELTGCRRSGDELVEIDGDEWLDQSSPRGYDLTARGASSASMVPTAGRS